METENNMTKAGTVPTAQDNETIASMDNLNRFTTAGMDLANKVVCARMLKELDAVVDLISKTALVAGITLTTKQIDSLIIYSRQDAHLQTAKVIVDHLLSTTCANHTVSM